MIARTWFGRTKAESAEAYQAYLERTGVADYLATEGNRGVLVLRRVQDGEAHFWFVSFWESFDAVRAFNDDVETARYYEEDEGFLLEMSPTVDNFEVMFWDPRTDLMDQVRERPATILTGLRDAAIIK